MGWYKLVKEEVFAGDDHITVKRKAMQEQSGWGTKPEENEASIMKS